jgi:hypothetical protein
MTETQANKEAREARERNAARAAVADGQAPAEPRLERRVVLVEPEVARVRDTPPRRRLARREAIADGGAHAEPSPCSPRFRLTRRGAMSPPCSSKVAQAIADGAQNVHTVNALNRLLEARNLAVAAAIFDAPSTKVVITPDGSNTVTTANPDDKNAK